MRIRGFYVYLPVALIAVALAGPLWAAGEPGGAKARPLPRFAGRTLDGERLDTNALAGRRALVYLFASSDRRADAIAGLVRSVLPDARRANVFVLGVNRDLDPKRGLEFAVAHGFDFPVLRDADLAISRKLSAPPGESLVLLVDGESSIFGGFAGFDAGVEQPRRLYEQTVREALHLERPGDLARPELGLLPPAPAFRVRTLDGEELGGADLEGRVVALVFFLPTCPHCHELLGFLEKLQRDLPGERFRIVAISVQNRVYTIRDMAKRLGLSFPLYVDPGREAQGAFGQTLGVPDTLLIDAGGRIFSRRPGSGPRVEALLTMEVRELLDLDNPILLDRVGYSGDAACRACHVEQHATWSLTAHAGAFETLAEHAEERNPECLECHTVGFGKRGGYALETPLAHLEGVGCESCHGRGGPHQSPDFAEDGYEAICASCHDSIHSLQFRLDERLPLVSHEDGEALLGLDLEGRQRLLERRERRTRTLFGAGSFVGSSACRECHEDQYGVWQGGPHARAFASLEQAGEQRNADCAACHTTGWEKPGGYPGGGPELAGVGCESCHGPGAVHVEQARADATRKGSILYLGDKCESCVILQICGSCHDDANDAGFEFELAQKLERIRHGSAGTAAE